MPIIAVVNIRQFSPLTRLKAAPESQVFCCKGHRTDNTHNQYHELRGLANGQYSYNFLSKASLAMSRTPAPKSLLFRGLA